MRYSSLINIVSFLLIITFCVCTSAFCADVPVPAPIIGQNYHLVKNWDFNRNVVNTSQLREQFFTRYASAKGTADHLNDEWEVYRDNDNHVISSGTLHLVARIPNGIEKGAIESGMIRSKWTGKYGYYEARMKLPKGRGMWPAFWFANSYWPPEIDVMESVNNGGDSSTKNSFHYLHGKYIGKTLFSLLDHSNSYHPGFDYADDFHTFAIEWTRTTVKHYVDNVLVVEREFEWRHDNGAEGEPTSVVINLAVGGSWPGAPIDESAFPASLDVSYIRVWQK